MPQSDAPSSRLAPTPESVTQMEEYGITKVPADYFVYGKYRYTSLDDAIAQARRERAMTK